METVITIVAVIAVAGFWIGLINPKWVFMPNRKRSSIVYLALCFVASALSVSIQPQGEVKIASTPQQKAPEQFKYATDTLGDWRKSTQSQRIKIITSFAETNNIAQSLINSFYNCVSEYSFTKLETIQLGTALDWCQTDYKNNPSSLSERVSFDVFEKQFRSFNGTYLPLENAIKNSMNDDASYKHVRTTYRLIMDRPPHAIVSTTFKGTNVYGAVVKQTVYADVDIKTGQIIKIIDSE
ncbi:TPA: hypothetical protein L9L56_004498 [Klebsiella pneumoniae]|uniref:hypothetical protein n=1 Tax=Klebsiella pneumoniae TaxID=573 RepID=UPI000E2EFCF0|nr:hypothetical protein [Klebsiella pneumoniae]HBR1366674.1 hypothetical protein [Klebsiella pneumoniae]HBR2014999.1 hypothetical protein [Klebsiella pneumoniae]